MNRVNPLYIGAVLLLILIFFAFKLNSAKSELIDAKATYSDTIKLAEELKELKIVYDNKSKTQKDLQKILLHQTLKPALIKQDMKKSSLKIDSESMGLDELNFIMGKLLNGTYNISSFKVKRLSDTKVSFHMEISW